MITARYFIEHVLAQLSDKQIERFYDEYPHINFTPQASDVSVDELPILMLVALTGTGKSTTLEALSEISTIPYAGHLPTRRELADLIIIPTAQALLNEDITPITDRAQRFFYTRTFANPVDGGFAAAYQWLYTTPTAQPLIL